ncbi:MAG TPA: Os1348 family NHLP clan protein [Candidatus Margulisiibacteriota bacterium]|nr:Os1348 family NHLP clan protein [Candidatus Margulisiibacteriota bacterium]
MSQRVVEHVLGKLLTDPEFRSAFMVQPVGVSRDLGFDLTPVEIAALSHVDERALLTLAAHLDPKIVRATTLHLDNGEGRLGWPRSTRGRRSQRDAG